MIRGRHLSAIYEFKDNLELDHDSLSDLIGDTENLKTLDPYNRVRNEAKLVTQLSNDKPRELSYIISTNWLNKWNRHLEKAKSYDTKVENL